MEHKFEPKVAIPSRGRANTILDRSIRIARESGIFNKNIYVFTRPSEEPIYWDKLAGLGINVIPVPPIEPIHNLRAEGLGATRNFMRRFFEPGELIVYMDDDIRGLWISQNGKGKSIDNGLKAIASYGFRHCLKHAAHLWGIYPVDNPYFARANTSTGLRYIIGALYGEINNPSPDLDVTTDDKEDFERTILNFKRDGAVIRNNQTGMKTNYYGEPGGMQDYRTPDSNRAGGLYLLKKYPQYCEPNTARKKHFEIKLKRL